VAPVLQVLTGKSAGTLYPLVQECVRLGRHPECEVVVDLNSVSRFHAQLVRDGENYLLEDLGSRNGSYINGRRAEGRVPLNDNDRVRICDTLFVYRTKAEGELAPAPPRAEEHENETTTTILSSIDASSSVDVLAKVNPEGKLRAVLEISQAIGQTLDLDTIYPKVLDSLFTIFPQADRALILLLDAAERLVPKCVKHRREDRDTVRFSKTIVRRAMGEQKAILSKDASSDERFALAESIADFRIRSVMCVPLLAGDRKPMGVIQIDTQSAHQQFDEDDLQILASVANQASTMLENARLHSEILKQERIRRELGFAKDVQAGFLPRRMPRVPGYDFWAYYEAAGQVGGDYYDFLTLPNGRQAIVLGDVSGKGVPAALLMAKATSDTKVALLTNPDSPAAAMGVLNNLICAASLEDKFITMALCVIDPATHCLTIVNAGHMSPMIRRASGAIEEPAHQEVSGLPAGVMEDFSYQAVEAPLAVGDCVVLFSDGISEAMNGKDEAYSIERIRSLLHSVPVSGGQFGELLIKDVRQHMGDRPQSDDISLVVFTRSASP
jgi:serine phosphatase RsbU (regulator of sigma subunit)